MNYLAHLFLSGTDPEIITGNFIGDFVKGKNYENFTEGMIKGIELHRAIDAFTDSHPVVFESKMRLRPVFHKYSPVITDVFYDHFLASEFHRFSAISLKEYSMQIFQELLKRESILPHRAQNMLKYMVPQNWLLHYASLEGINKALSGMSQRTTFNSGMEKAASFLESDYHLYKNEFDLFFPELQQHCHLFISKSKP